MSVLNIFFPHQMTEATLKNLSAKLQKWSLNWEQSFNKTDTRASNAISSAQVSMGLSSTAQTAIDAKSSQMSLNTIQDKLSNWSSKWKDTVNRLKTQQITLSSSRKPFKATEVSSGSQHLNKSHFTKYDVKRNQRNDAETHGDTLIVPNDTENNKNLVHDIIETGKIAKIKIKYKNERHKMELKHLRQVAALKAAQNVTDQSIKMYKNDNLTKEKKIMELHDRLGHQSLTLAKARSENEVLNLELERQKQQMSVKAESLQQERTRYLQEVQINEELQENIEEHQQLKSDNKKLGLNVEHCETQLSKCRAQLSEEEAKNHVLKDQIAQLTIERDAAQQQADSRIQESNLFQKKFADASDRESELKLSIQVANARCQSVEMQLQRSHEQISQLLNSTANPNNAAAGEEYTASSLNIKLAEELATVRAELHAAKEECDSVRRAFSTTEAMEKSRCATTQ